MEAGGQTESWFGKGNEQNNEDPAYFQFEYDNKGNVKAFKSFPEGRGEGKPEHSRTKFCDARGPDFARVQRLPQRTHR